MPGETARTVLDLLTRLHNSTMDFHIRFEVAAASDLDVIVHAAADDPAKAITPEEMTLLALRIG